MAGPRTWAPWAALFGAIATIEILVRFAVPFNLRLVLAVEAVLFMAATFVSFTLIQRAPASSGWRRRLAWGLVWAFALGGLRAAIWASGQPVMRANLAVLFVVVVALIGGWIRRRRRVVPPPPPPSGAVR